MSDVVQTKKKRKEKKKIFGIDIFKDLLIMSEKNKEESNV